MACSYKFSASPCRKSHQTKKMFFVWELAAGMRWSVLWQESFFTFSMTRSSLCQSVWLDRVCVTFRRRKPITSKVLFHFSLPVFRTRLVRQGHDHCSLRSFSLRWEMFFSFTSTNSLSLPLRNEVLSTHLNFHELIHNHRFFPSVFSHVNPLG